VGAVVDESVSDSGVGASDTGLLFVEESLSATRIVPPPHAISAASGIKSTYPRSIMVAPVSMLARGQPKLPSQGKEFAGWVRMGKSPAYCDVDHT
jgi:hypothetical protein